MNPKNGAKVFGAMLSIALAILGPLRNASAADAPARVVRVGFLGVARSPSGATSRVVQELQKYGYVEGKNLVVEYRPLEAASELAKLNIDVICAISNPAAFAAQRATRTIPIVVWGAMARSRPG
jgi:ABC-type uncharacterized transport system substrate-binding protein